MQIFLEEAMILRTTEKNIQLYHQLSGRAGDLVQTH